MKKKRQQLFIVNNPNAPRLSSELAVEIGLNESILLLQIEFWISLKPKERDGHLWTYQSLRKIKECFPFWGVETINRALHSLQAQRLILIRNYNRTGYDRTRWFALDARGFKKLRSVQLVDSEPIDRHFSKWEMEDVKMGNRSGQNETTIPETTTEKSTERSRARRAAPLSSKSTKDSTPADVIEIAQALADVTGRDFDLNRAKLIKEARELAGGLAGKSENIAGDLRTRYGAGGWWYTADWRGKKGSAPSMANIRETWGQWDKTATTTKTTRPKIMRR